MCVSWKHLQTTHAEERSLHESNLLGSGSKVQTVRGHRATVSTVQLGAIFVTLGPGKVVRNPLVCSVRGRKQEQKQDPLYLLTKGLLTG